MSAAFHVEFWDSSPSTTHKAVLQQSLGNWRYALDLNGIAELLMSLWLY